MFVAAFGGPSCRFLGGLGAIIQRASCRFMRGLAASQPAKEVRARPGWARPGQTDGPGWLAGPTQLAGWLAQASLPVLASLAQPGSAPPVQVRI